MKQRIETWKRMVENGDPRADAYLAEITAMANAEGKIDEMNDAISFMLDRADSHLDNIQRKLAGIV